MCGPADAAVLEQPGQHPVHDGRADLALDVVADDRHPGGRNFSAHSGSEAMNTGIAFTNATPASIAHCA